MSKLNPQKLDDYDWLYDQYIIQHKSQSEIGKSVGRSGKLVSLKLKKHNIQTRSSKEGMQYIDYKKRNRLIYEKSGHKIINSLRRNFDSFVADSKKIHGDKYEYLGYTNKKTVSGVFAIIKCKEHNYTFRQRPANHLKGKGCSKCGNAKLMLTTDKFIEKARRIHSDKYDYNSVILKNGRKSIIKIKCPTHGEFKQIAENHLRGHGCVDCANEAKKKNHNKFVDQIREIYKDHYKVLSEYIGDKNEIIIKCKLHGEFRTTPNRLMVSKGGCSKCSANMTNPQREIIEFIEQYREVIINDRTIISPYEVDCNAGDFGIEMHGIYWHSFNKKETKDEKYRHYYKADLALSNNYLVYQIYENEWKDKTDIIKSIIKNKMGLSNKIYARKCDIVELDNNNFSDFMSTNHMQGHINSRVKYALTYDNEIVCCMGFNKHKKYEWEVSRFANKINNNVIGGASKLLRHFTRSHGPKTIMTYCDRRFSAGNLYKALGFKLDSITQPGYCYVKDNMVFNRHQFQKHKLLDKLDNFDPSLTESENMFNNRYRRLWDAGHFKFIWSK